MTCNARLMALAPLVSLLLLAGSAAAAQEPAPAAPVPAARAAAAPAAPVTAASAAAAPVTAASAVEAAAAPAARVYVGLYLHDVSNLSLGAGTYEIDADLWVKWFGDFDPEEVRFANASDIEMETLERSHDGGWHSARFRVRGTLRGDFPVQDFPLDKQTVSVQLELPRSKGELIPDLAGSGIARRFSITDWTWAPDFFPTITTERYPSDLGSITDEGRSAEVRRVRFDIALERPLVPVVLKLFLPLLVVALIVFLSLFVPADSLQPRLTMCVTGLVACFAFQFSVADVMPSVAYLTLADVLFITVYVLAIVCVGLAVVGFVLQSKGGRARADKLQRGARFVIPALMGVAIFLAMPSTAEPQPLAVPDLPAIGRKPSARDLIRIGTTTPLRLASSPVGAASFWGLTFEPAGGRAQALVVERMPRIDSDAMRFGSDGSLAVTWTIREGARWSDGSPIVTDDITLPFELRPDPRVTAIDTPDERTVVLTWNARVVDAVRAPELWPSAHLRAAIDPSDADALTRYLGYAMRPSTGPYKVDSLDESRIVASRNPHFLLEPASIARVELRYFKDRAALRDALLRGEIDLTTPNALATEDLTSFEGQAKLRAVESPSASFVFLGLPLRGAPWDSADARRALLEAIDRDKLAATDWGGAGRVAELPCLGDPPADIRRTPYDAEAARARFEALGLIGHELPLRWSPPLSARFVDSIVADLRAAGLEPRPEEVQSTWPLWSGQDFDGLLLHQVRVERDSDTARWWALPRAGGRLQTAHRHAAWTDETKALVDQYEHALFRERREQLKARIERAWVEALPMIPLVFAGERSVVDTSLEGWERVSDGLFGEGLDGWYFR